jgi:hypothetical protein
MVKGSVVFYSVNPELSIAEHDACLELLERGLVHIRLAALGGDAARAEAIADALHNLPRLLREGQKWRWSLAKFRELFLDELVAKFPELAGLQQPLDDIE